MEPATFTAIAALVIGVIGLAVCALAMAHVLPDRPPGWWWRVRDRWQQRRAPDPADEPRRVVTGASAADRLTPDARPARHPALRPDILRRERQRLSAEAARRIVTQLADDDPARIAGVVDELLAEDRRQALDEQRPRRTRRRTR